MSPPTESKYTPITHDAGGLDELPRLTKEAASLGGAVVDDTLKDKAWYERTNWVHVTILFGTPALALYGLCTTPLRWETAVWMALYYTMTGIGITAGYHRLFAHQCYKAHWALRWYLMLMASGAVQGSLRWWSRDHRAHHKYVDTDKDPYAAPKGFWYSHIGWMLVKQDPKRIGKVDISDLEEDWMIKTQHKFYPVFGLGMGYVFPALVAWLLWNDPWGGFFFGGCLRLVFVHHSTFCVNSLAHYAGEQGYSDGHTAKDSILTALVTFGEGYHNFHHEFPNDYRNGYEWWQWDPTKWFINAMAALGLAYDLVRFPRSEIEKGKVQMDHKRVYDRATRFDWGPDPAALPLMTAADVKRLCAKEGRSLVTLNGFVLDLKPFVDQHPGGPGYIRSNLGEDITDMFCGETYRHSNAAANLAATFRIARLQKAS